MRILSTLLFFSASTLASAQAAKSEQDALALAIASQQTLNEYAIGAAEPEAMKYAQRLKLTRAALQAQRQQWTTATRGHDPSEKFRACRSALDQASHVAGLSASKAVSAVDDQVFTAEKGQLKKLRTDCDELIRRSGRPG